MSISNNSILADLLAAIPAQRAQMYFKSSLTALSHAMEDQILADSKPCLIIASFQRERFYRQEAHRYRRIGGKSDQVYVLAAPETDFKHSSGIYETIAFSHSDSLALEWHLVVLTANYASCLICREKISLPPQAEPSVMDNNRRFEGIWTFDRAVTQTAAKILLQRILAYRPELKKKIARAHREYLQPSLEPEGEIATTFNTNPEAFVQRLVTYLQASQYKLLKTNRQLAEKEKKERLLNFVTAAIRRTLDPDEIMQVAVEKLGEGLGVCRCLIYRCKETETNTQIKHEFYLNGITSITGQSWPLKDNDLFQEVVQRREALSIENTLCDPRIAQSSTKGVLQNLVTQCSIFSWLLVPILYQDKLMGMIELHHCGPMPAAWKSDDIALVDAIATQVGVGLIQGEAYANLEDLNQQLEALDRTRSNLVAITGHELRTPLSTIQVCLESLALEPDMSPELRQVMLNTALSDAERMRKLVQDFLTLSQLESGRIQWHPEPISLKECVDLATSHLRTRAGQNPQAQVYNLISADLPLIQVDGEWLVEVLTKLLDNACKFTNNDGEIKIEAIYQNSDNLEVVISDTGRGIEPNRLETVFDRFYQEEGSLRRSVGGTGLGLAICRQIINCWDGQIWAESEGKNLGSKFRFTVPIVKEYPNSKINTKTNNTRKGGKKRKSSNV